MFTIIFGVFAGCFLLERIVPGWRLPKVRTWPLRVVVINLVQLAVVILAGATWQLWLSRWSVFHLSSHVSPLAGGLIAYFIATFLFYWWHRWRHEVPILWRVFHQIHHSAQRIEVITSFYKHPGEMIVNSVIGALLVYALLGLSPAAGAIYTLCTALGEFFYHANVRTPRWVGYVFQRPEMHRVHHEFGRHRNNYGDIVWWDMLFGTYENPQAFKATCGFEDAREQQLIPMLAYRDVHADASEPLKLPVPRPGLTLAKVVIKWNQGVQDMHWLIRISLLALLFAVSGCASMLGPPSSTKHAGSVVDYLYPDAKAAPQLQPEVIHLHPPVRVGVAFVPGCACGTGPSEAEKAKLLEQVKESFSKYGYIGSIEIIPSSYLRARGGFENLDQVSRMLNVEVIALVSYDQIQFNDTNSLALLYWTIVGAYVIQGDKYDVQTLVDTSVFDIGSRKLLFRAPGSSEIKGSASMAGFSERSRAAQGAGYQQAVDQMIPALHAELGNFKERIKSDAAFKVENKPGYSGAGDFGWLGLILALSLCGVGYARRSQV